MTPDAQRIAALVIAHQLVGPWHQEGQPLPYRYAGSCWCGAIFFAESRGDAINLWAAHTAAILKGNDHG